MPESSIYTVVSKKNNILRTLNLFFKIYINVYLFGVAECRYYFIFFYYKKILINGIWPKNFVWMLPSLYPDFRHLFPNCNKFHKISCVLSSHLPLITVLTRLTFLSLTGKAWRHSQYIQVYPLSRSWMYFMQTFLNSIMFLFFTGSELNHCDNWNKVKRHRNELLWLISLRLGGWQRQYCSSWLPKEKGRQFFFVWRWNIYRNYSWCKTKKPEEEAEINKTWPFPLGRYYWLYLQVCDYVKHMYVMLHVQSTSIHGILCVYFRHQQWKPGNPRRILLWGGQWFAEEGNEVGPRSQTRSFPLSRYTWATYRSVIIWIKVLNVWSVCIEIKGIHDHYDCSSHLQRMILPMRWRKSLKEETWVTWKLTTRLMW